MADRTVLSRAATNSKSLRTTVPRGIVKHFDLKEGGSLEWKLEIRNAKLTIDVSPVRQEIRQPIADIPQIRQRTLAAKPAPQETNNEQQDKRRWRRRQKN